MRRAAIALLWMPVFALSCGTCQPPPDPDAVQSGAQPLPLGRWQRGALDCGEGDCADWYHFETPVAGALRVEVARVEEDGAEERALPEFSVALADADGKPLGEAKSGGKTSIQIGYPQKKGRYVDPQRFAVAVQTPVEGEGALDYELRVTVTVRPRAAPPPPPLPRFRVVQAVLLEVQSRAGGDAVLIDRGSRAGIEPGQRGRLLAGGKKIAEIEILEVYADGSRAVIRGALDGALSPETVA